MMRVCLLLLAAAVTVKAFVPVAPAMGIRALTSASRGTWISSLSMSTAVEEETETMAVGSKLSDQSLAKEAVKKFFEDIDPEAVTMVPTSGGVNNIVQYLTFPDGTKKLLRIYNNGFDSKIVNFEHEVLKVLYKEGHADTFDFKIPKYKEFKDTSKTFATLSNGAEACIVDFIEGELPKTSCAEDIGRASGMLVTAMGKCTDLIEAECNCDPYYEMWEMHPAVNKENFIETMKGSDFDGEIREPAELILDQTIKITEKCEGEYKDLPSQLIHGDLHYDNVLVKDGKVSGLLDFEFALYDWRAMELATCLSKYAGEDNGMELFEQFVKGYATTAELTPLECKAIPDLINLRVLSNAVYFVGRALGKEDNISSLTTRVANYADRVKWIQDKEGQIVDICLKYFSK